MAYVRTTEKLLDGIYEKIAAMRRKATDRLESKRLEPGTPMFEEVRSAVLAEAWSLAPNLRNQMPDKWCYFSKEVQVRLDDAQGQCVLSTRMQLPETSQLRLPNKPSSWLDNIVVSHADQSGALRDWLAEHYAREQEAREITEQYEAVWQQIRAFMATKTSLNAALKEMPELELYIPDEYMAKYREPTAPRANTSANKPEAPEIEVDRDQLAALGIAHRIATAAE